VVVNYSDVVVDYYFYLFIYLFIYLLLLLLLFGMVTTNGFWTHLPLFV